ncbi:hypothetical protein [Microtetraspora malaysiensis]|uniref:hypothetical protein n=1 Tax=Microtetraspora malaysiensis TaxID=161358 RepID=UPI003D8BAAC1
MAEMIKPVDNQAMTGKPSRTAGTVALLIIWLVWAIGALATLQTFSMALVMYAPDHDSSVAAFRVVTFLTWVCVPAVGGFVALATERPWTATLFGLILCVGLFLTLLGSPKSKLSSDSSTPTWRPSSYCVERSGGDCPGG